MRDLWDGFRFKYVSPKTGRTVALAAGPGDGTPGRIFFTDEPEARIYQLMTFIESGGPSDVRIRQMPFTEKWCEYWNVAAGARVVLPFSLDEPLVGTECPGDFWTTMTASGRAADVRYGRDGVPASSLPESPIGRPVWVSNEGERAQDRSADFAAGYAYIAAVRWRLTRLALYPDDAAKINQKTMVEIAAIDGRGPLLKYIAEHSDVLLIDVQNAHQLMLHPPPEPPRRPVVPPPPPRPLPADPLGDVRVHTVPEDWKRLRVLLLGQPFAIVAYPDNGYVGRLFFIPFAATSLPASSYWMARVTLDSFCTIAIDCTLSPPRWYTKTIPEAAKYMGPATDAQGERHVDLTLAFEPCDDTGPIQGEEHPTHPYPAARRNALAWLNALEEQGIHPLDDPACPLGKDLWYSPEAQARNDRRADLAHGRAMIKAIRHYGWPKLDEQRTAREDPVFGELNRYILDLVAAHHPGAIAEAIDAECLPPDAADAIRGLGILGPPLTRLRIRDRLVPVP